MYGLFECMSSGCVAQKDDHAKIPCQMIEGWDRTLAGHHKSIVCEPDNKHRDLAHVRESRQINHRCKSCG